LVTSVTAQARDSEPWQEAELHLMEAAFHERLRSLGVQPTAEVAVTLMAAAYFLAEHTCEWGGDARDALGEVALLGLRLLESGEG
jgi:hypothetical protein